MELAYPAHEQDTEEQTSKRKYLRALCKQHLQAGDKVEMNCPIILPKVDFVVFSDYMVSRVSKSGKRLSKAAYSGMRSALMYLAGYYQCGQQKMWIATTGT